MDTTPLKTSEPNKPATIYEKIADSLERLEAKIDVLIRRTNYDIEAGRCAAKWSGIDFDCALPPTREFGMVATHFADDSSESFVTPARADHSATYANIGNSRRYRPNIPKNNGATKKLDVNDVDGVRYEENYKTELSEDFA